MPEKSQVRENKKPLHIFFSYSTKDYEIVRDSIRASEVLGVHPIIPSEIVSVGESIAGKIRRTIHLSDLVIFVFSRETSPAVIFELETAANQGRPLLLFAEKGTRISSLVTSRFVVHYFEDSNDLAQLVTQAIQKIQPEIKPTISDEEIKRWESQIWQNIVDSNKRSVLILGKDNDEEGWKNIQRIKRLVSSKGYYPLILKELPELEHVSLERKMLVLGALARFVIAEDSRPSGHIDEVKICAINEFITTTLREAGTGSTWMQAHYPTMYSFMNRFCYEGAKGHVGDSLCSHIYPSLEEAVHAAVKWAEDRISEQERAFKDMYKSIA